MPIRRENLLLSLLLGAALPGAQAECSGRVMYVAYGPSGQLEAQATTHHDGGLEERSNFGYQAQNASGPALEFSQRFGRWLGYTVHLSYVTLEFSRHERAQLIDSTSATTITDTVSKLSDETVFIPLFGSFDFHLLPPGRFDLYTGPVFGFSWYDELFGGWVDDHFLYGLGAGLDVDLGNRWAISTVIRFIQAEAEPREGGYLLRGTGEINVDPWQVEIGIAYRFGKAGP